MEQFPALNTDCFDQQIAERLDSQEAPRILILYGSFSDRLKAPRWLRTEQCDMLL